MKKLDQMILREMFVPFFVGTIAFLFLFQMNFLIFWFKTFHAADVPFSGILKLTLLNIPENLRYTFPIGVALGTSLAFARITRESELTAMRAATASVRRTLWPVVLAGIFVSVLAFANIEYAMPKASRQFTNLSIKLGTLGALPNIDTNVPLKLKNFNVSIGRLTRDREGYLLNNMLLIEHQDNGQAMIITCDDANYRHGLWTLNNPTTFVIVGQDVISMTPKKGSTVINQEVDLAHIGAGSLQRAEERTIPDLQKLIADHKRGGIRTVEEEVELHSRYAMPASCFIFALVAPLLSIRWAKNGAFIGVILSLFLIGLYYNAFIIATQIIGPNRWAPPIVAAWLPNLLFVVMGLFALRRLE